MRIISSPDIVNWLYQCSCLQYYSKLEINSEDLKHKIDKDYNCRQYDHYYVNCPLCEFLISIREDDIPYFLKEKNKEK